MTEELSRLNARAIRSSEEAHGNKQSPAAVQVTEDTEKMLAILREEAARAAASGMSEDQVAAHVAQVAQNASDASRKS